MVNRPRTCLGTVQWGMDYGVSNRNGIPTDDELERILESAMKNGIRHLDTARNYGNSEERIGHHIAQHQGNFHITTKIDIPLQVLKSSKEKISQLIRDSINSSLKALQVQKIDNVLLHRGYFAIENGMIAWSTLQEIQNVGLIGKIGISAANPDEAKLALELPGCEVVQVASSLLDQRLTRSGFFVECQAMGVETFVRSIFLQGVAFIEPEDLNGKLVELRDVLLKIQHFAAEINLTAADIWKTFASDIDADFLVVGFTNDWELQKYLEHETPSAKEQIRAFFNQIELLPEYILDPSHWSGKESSRLFKTE